jgi:AraC-like DNA-binding protein
VREHYTHTVGPPLRPYVTLAVGYRYAGAPPGVHIGLPSGTLTLVVPFDEPLLLSGAGLSRRTPFEGVLAGLATAPTLIHHEGRQHGVQLSLTPAGARALFGLPAAELAERSVELEAVVGRVARSLRDELQEHATWRERFAAVERIVLELVRANDSGRQAAPEVRKAWRLIRQGRGSTPVAAVASDVGWSTRHLEHRFRGEFGITPKSAVRLTRFERSVEVVRDPRRRLADVAAECGYADQAHLAREWRELAGLPPSRWRAEDDLAFVQDDEAARSAAWAHDHTY